MNLYRFTGISNEKFCYEGQIYLVKTLAIGVGFYAKIKADTLRKALKYLNSILSGVSFSLDNVYSVTNRHGKVSFRFLKGKKNER